MNLGSTDAFSKVGDIFVMELKIPPPCGGGEAGKGALGMKLDGTHG